MRLSFGQEMRLVQKQVLAPRMIQSMEILQLPIMALQERIQQELQENPVLEQKDNNEEPAIEVDFNADDSPTEEPRDYDSKELVIESDGSNAEDFDRLEALNKDWENSFNEEHRPSRN